MTGARFGFWASVVMGVGLLLSGPLGLALVHFIGPQPEWSGVDRFVHAYHPIQIVPYVFGLALVWGAAGVVVAFADRTIHRGARALARFAVAAFVTLVSLNYILQTTFVPSLVRSYEPSSAVMIEHLTMSNPRSLGWALEMWGYGFLGAATWLVVPSAPESALERSCARLLVANGVLSIVGAVVTMLRLEWVFSTAGLAGFALWNVLMFALAFASALFWRERSFAITPRFAV